MIISSDNTVSVSLQYQPATPAIRYGWSRQLFNLWHYNTTKNEEIKKRGRHV